MVVLNKISIAFLEILSIGATVGIFIFLFHEMGMWTILLKLIFHKTRFLTLNDHIMFPVVSFRS